MNTQLSKYCSQAQAGKYLLNKMTPDEETLFQSHLEACKTCQAYVNTVRRLSCLISDEEPAYLQTAAATKQQNAQKIRLWSIASIAASVLVILGISYAVFTNRESESGVLAHETFIEQRTTADRMEIAVEMLFPDKEIVTMDADRPLVFKWNKETDYKLVVKHDNQLVLETEGFGELYELATKSMEGFTELDWVLTAEGQDFKGTIHIK